MNGLGPLDRSAGHAQQDYSRDAWSQPQARCREDAYGPPHHGHHLALKAAVKSGEAWIVKALGPEIPTHQLPHFSRQAQPKAQIYYQPNQAPPQWKDLERQARIDCGWEDDEEFYEHAATEIAAKAAQLSATSVSFKNFHAQICAWD